MIDPSFVVICSFYQLVVVCLKDDDDRNIGEIVFLLFFILFLVSLFIISKCDNKIIKFIIIKFNFIGK